MATAVGLEDKKEETADMLLRLYDLFLKKDALLIEVNPYAEDASGKCIIILAFLIFLNIHFICL